MKGNLQRVVISSAVALLVAGAAEAREPDQIQEEVPLMDLYNEWEGGDGKLTVGEWDTAIDQLFGEQDVNLIASAWDDNQDGVISPEEFEEAAARTDLLTMVQQKGGAAAQQGAQAAGNQQVAELYDQWAGEDNELTVDEWNQAADQRFGEQDVNLDASAWDDDGNGIISRTEFKEEVEEQGLFDI